MTRREVRTLWVGGCLSVICAALAFAFLGAGMVRQWLRRPAPAPSDADWTLSSSARSVVLIKWPALAPSLVGDTWYISPHAYRRLTVSLPGRPLIVCVDPSNIYIKCKNGQIETITITGNPVTAHQAVDKLQADAAAWGWHSISPELNRWIVGHDSGAYPVINNADSHGAGFVPVVGEEIRPGGDPTKPVQTNWDISWQPEDR